MEYPVDISYKLRPGMNSEEVKEITTNNILLQIADGDKRFDPNHRLGGTNTDGTNFGKVSILKKTTRVTEMIGG